jgi:hypothetical protein
MSKKCFLLQCIALVLFLVAGAAPGMAFNRYDAAVQKNEYMNAGNTKSLVDVLDRAGVLPIVKNLVPEFHDLMVKVEKLFHALDRDRHRHIHDLNKVLGHLKDTWSRALDEIMSEKRRSNEIVDVNAFRAFLEKYKVLLDQAIQTDGLENSDIVQFMDQLDHLFRALEAAYAVIFFGLKDLNIPFQLNWFIFSQTKLIVNMIPSNLFDPEMLGELMTTPKEMMNQFIGSIEELYEQLMDSPAGQYVPLIVNMIQTMSARQQRHVDL